MAYLRREQDLDLQAFGLAFDNYYLESSLYTSGRVEATVKALIAGGHTYEDGGALWLRTTELGTGDDKDRVMRRARAATPTSCPTWPITRPSGNAVSTAP